MSGVGPPATRPRKSGPGQAPAYVWGWGPS
eukprot:gene21772-biopygen10199